MKTKTEEKIRTHETWNRAATKGALVWGTVYSTATSSAAYLLAPVVTGSAPAFNDILMDSLVIFPTAGAARGVLMWRSRKGKTESDRLDVFTSKAVKKHKHPIRFKKAA